MGTYEIAFYAAGVPPIFAAILMFLIPKKQKPQEPEQVRRYCKQIAKHVHTRDINSITHSKMEN